MEKKLSKKQLREVRRDFATSGGKARMKGLTKKQRRDLGKSGAAKRWGNKKHENSSRS